MLRKSYLNHKVSAFSWLPRAKARWSIRVLLLCLVLAVALPFIGLVVFTEYEQARNAVTSASKSALNLTEVAASSTEQFLLDTKALLAQLAPRALPYVVDSATCNSFQREFANLPTQYTILEVITVSGKSLCSTAQLPSENIQVVADRQWFQNVLRKNQFTVSGPLVGRITGKWSVVLGYPLDDDHGQVVGILALSIDLVRYQFVLDAVTLVPGSVITIVDEAGTVIARSPDSELFVGKDVRGTEIVDTVLQQASGWAQAQGIDGVDRIYGFTTIDADRWHVYAGIPTDAVLANMRAGLLRGGLLALVITLVVLAGAFQLSRYIARPIRTLATTAQAVTQGQLQARAPFEGPLEVAQVAARFNEMVEVRVQDERALRDSEARLRLVIDQLPMLLWTTDADLRFTSNLGKGFQARDLQPNQLVGQSVLEVLHTADPQFPAILSHRQALEGQSRAYELEWAGRIYEAYVEPLRDDQGHIIGCIGVALDVTERKRAEEALRRSEERFRAVVEHSLDAILLYSADGVTLYASPSISRINGFSAQELVGKNRFDWIHPDEIEQLRKEWSALLQQPGNIVRSQARGRHKDGSWLWIERVFHNLLDDPGVGAIVVNFRDITDQVQAEEALRRSEERFRALIENSSDGITLNTADGIILYLSSSSSRVIGYSSADLLGRNLFELIHPDEVEQVKDQRVELVQQPGRIVRSVFRFRHKDGSWRWIECISQNLLGDPNVGAVVGNFRDITEGKRAEQALQDSESKFRSIFETAHSIILMADRQGKILDINRYAEEVLGYSVSELRHRNMFDGLYVPEDRPQMRQVIQDLTEGRNREYEVRWIAKDGRIVTFAGSSTSRFSPEGEFLSTLCAFVDITERKRAEEALQRYTLRLETLHAIDQAILAAHSLPEIGQAALHRVIDLVPCQSVSVTLLDQEVREVIGVAVQDRGESKFVPGQRLPLEDAKGGIDDLLAVLRQGEILVVNNITTLPQSPLIRTALEAGRRSLLCAPLRAQDELVGMLNLWADQPARFGPDDADTVRDVADSLAVAITQVQLFDEVTTGREQMRRLASRIVSAQEQERRRIASELHDEIGQNLTAVKINLDLVDQLPDDQARTKLTEATTLVDELLNRIRNLSLDLRPAMLDDLGLLPTLQSFFERYTKQMNIQVIFRHNSLDARFPAEVESAAYRIVQETLTNVARHARVSEATVRVWVDQNVLNVQIEDHGIGFDPGAALAATDKSGLIGMRERAMLLGGQLNVESSVGGGTRLTAELPVRL